MRSLVLGEQKHAVQRIACGRSKQKGILHAYRKSGVNEFYTLHISKKRHTEKGEYYCL